MPTLEPWQGNVVACPGDITISIEARPTYRKATR